MRSFLLLLIAAAAVTLVALKASGVLNAPAPTPRDLAEQMLASTALQPAARGEGPPVFVDVAAELGLVFRHDHDANGRYLLPEEMGPGVGFIDYDNDDDQDILVAGGGAIVEGQTQRCRLYRNDGDRFVDVSAATGADVAGPAYGIACADYDNDGDVDVFISRLGANVLLRNDGAGRFVDETTRAGVGDEQFGTSAAFLDFDRDGWLDLYVANYVVWSLAAEMNCYSPSGVADYCNPITLPPSSDRLYRNLGDGRFEDVTVSAGIEEELGNGLGVLVNDVDEDGWPDIYVANDQTPAFLWHNKGDGTFENMAIAAGCAYDRAGVAIAGMGVAGEDFDDDGDFDLLVTNIRDQNHLLLQNEGGRFADRSLAVGLPQWSRPATGFGIAVFDQDLDGRLDAYIANGAVNRSERREHAANPYAEPDHFIRWIDGGFQDRTSDVGLIDPDAEESGRGVAIGDLENDGDLDVLVTNNGGPLRVYRNTPRTNRNWLMLDVREHGRTAIGARVSVHAGGRRWLREVRPHQSYLSSNDPRVHVGLGDAQRVDRIEVRWVDGTQEERRDVDVNQMLRIERRGNAG